MAGRIIANTIVAGYPEPGVTADEIVGMINKYGLPLGSRSAKLSQVYHAGGDLLPIKNTSATLGVPFCAVSETLESWDSPSNVLISIVGVIDMTPESVISYGSDDIIMAGVEVAHGADDEVAADASSIGIVGTSYSVSSNPYIHGQYQMYHVQRVPAGMTWTIVGRLVVAGSYAIQLAADDLLSGRVLIRAIRVIE